MINEQHFKEIKQNHGTHGSFAVWAPKGDKPKSNISDVACIANSLTNLHSDTVLVGLNLAREVSSAPSFANFHDGSCHAQDFKLRYALEGTRLEGAYMTDVLKGLVEVDSSKAIDGLLPAALAHNIKFLREELKDVGAVLPTIYALGTAAYRLLKDNLKAGTDYARLVKLTHYSFTGKNKEALRAEYVAKIS